MQFSLRFSALAALVSLLALLSGCASLVAPMGDKPTDQNFGKRTFGAKIEDQNIERKIKINLYRAAPEIREAGKVKVISINGNVLLVGEVAKDEYKSKAANIAKRVRHVRSVHNELKVGEKNSAFSSMTDSWITGKAKTRLLFSSKTPGKRTKVVTRGGVVYLMGLVTRSETEQIIQRVQKVYGVQKIVKILEYIEQPSS